MSVNFSIKGLLNQHLKVGQDECNITNNNNSHIFSQLISGNINRPSLDYLLNLNYMRLNDAKSINAYNGMNLAAQINSYQKYNEILDDKTIYLLKTKKVKCDFFDVLEQRHSARHFSSNPMSLQDFSLLCKYSFGIANRKMNYDGIITNTRYYASGGGLYPIDVYFITNNIKKIEKGVYKYQHVSHSLYPIDINIDEQLLFEHGDFDFENYSLITMYRYDIHKNYLKYGELSLMLSFIETGIISHNFELVSSALGYTTCQIAGFDKQYIQKKMHIDGINSHILFTNICGRKQ